MAAEVGGHIYRGIRIVRLEQGLIALRIKSLSEFGQCPLIPTSAPTTFDGEVFLILSLKNY